MWKKCFIVACAIVFGWSSLVNAYSIFSDSDNELIDNVINRLSIESAWTKKKRSKKFGNIVIKSQETYNTLSWSVKDKKKSSISRAENIAAELERSLQIASEDSFVWYAVTKLPTPVYILAWDDVDINWIMGWKNTTWVHFDDYNTIDELDVVLLPWTSVTLLKEIKTWWNLYYQIRTREFDAWLWSEENLYIDSRFVENIDYKAWERKSILPSKEEIIQNLYAALWTQYVWWWNWYQWISEIDDFYETPVDVELSELEHEYKILQWTDCSGLLWQATDWYTPRNTRGLLTFWSGVAISWNTIDEIVNKVEPLDLIVWAWHVIVILDKEHAIESLRKENFEWGAEVVDLHERLEDIFTKRYPVDEYNESFLLEKEKFVVRRWYDAN